VISVKRRKKMKKGFYVFLTTGLVLSLVLLGSLAYGATAKGASVKQPQYGGTVTFARALNPISWDNSEWQWKHANDTGFYMEHLLMGDLQKGPRGTKEFAFHSQSWIPPEATRGELLESWEVKKTPCRSSCTYAKGSCGRKSPE
jgi:hypothetical protein